LHSINISESIILVKEMIVVPQMLKKFSVTYERPYFTLCNNIRVTGFYMVRFKPGVEFEPATLLAKPFTTSQALKPTLEIQCKMLSCSLQYRAETGSACHLLSCWYLARVILRPWRRRWYDPPKRRLTFNGLHGFIAQKIVLFITTAARTSSSTSIWLYCELWHRALWQVSPLAGTV
jgi:hypothetical protein